jgi:hypothetical protein
MMKWLATVTIELFIEVEALTAEEAEDLVRNEDFDDYPKDIYIDIEPSEE